MGQGSDSMRALGLRSPDIQLGLFWGLNVVEGFGSISHNRAQVSGIQTHAHPQFLSKEPELWRARASLTLPGLFILQ